MVTYWIGYCMVNAHVHQKLADILLYIIKVAKKILMYKNLPPQVFWQPMAKKTIVIYLNVSNVYNNDVSVSHFNLLLVWCF